MVLNTIHTRGKKKNFQTPSENSLMLSFSFSKTKFCTFIMHLLLPNRLVVAAFCTFRLLSCENTTDFLSENATVSVFLCLLHHKRRKKNMDIFMNIFTFLFVFASGIFCGIFNFFSVNMNDINFFLCITCKIF